MRSARRKKNLNRSAHHSVRRQCLDKQRHRSPEGAIRHAVSLVRSGKAHTAMHAYCCPICGGYHVGGVRKSNK